MFYFTILINFYFFIRLIEDISIYKNIFKNAIIYYTIVSSSKT